MMKAQTAILITSITASATLTAAFITAGVAYFANKRERRRLLYSEAVKAALAWKEMLYRVRRRGEGQERELIDLFHSRQDDLTYYRAWVGSESEAMQRSYDSLVKNVKKITEPLIQKAWQASIRPIPGDAVPGETHPDFDEQTDAFLADVRDHLSPKPWKKWQVKQRHPAGGEKK